MTRYKAASIHLVISACIFLLFLALVFFVWYVYPYNHTQGVANIVYIMAGVDVVLGPLCTLLLFKSGKKGLILDISVIAAFQIAALLFGAHTIYSERPSYIVFAHNKFDVVVKGEINMDELPKSIKKVGFFDKPEFVFQPRSANPNLDEFVFGMTAEENGPNRLSANVKGYRNYSENIKTVLENTKQIVETPELLSENLNEKLHYAIVGGKVKQAIVLLKPEDASVVGFLHKSKLLGF